MARWPKIAAICSVAFIQRDWNVVWIERNKDESLITTRRQFLFVSSLWANESGEMETMEVEKMNEKMSESKEKKKD